MYKRQADRGIAPNRVLLAGFSQGGAVTLAAGIARTQPLAGLIALSTYLPMTLAQAQDALKPGATSQPVFMAHGQFDPVDVSYTHLDVYKRQDTYRHDLPLRGCMYGRWRKPAVCACCTATTSRFGNRRSPPSPAAEPYASVLFASGHLAAQHVLGSAWRA